MGGLSKMKLIGNIDTFQNSMLILMIVSIISYILIKFALEKKLEKIPKLLSTIISFIISTLFFYVMLKFVVIPLM